MRSGVLFVLYLIMCIVEIKVSHTANAAFLLFIFVFCFAILIIGELIGKAFSHLTQLGRRRYNGKKGTPKNKKLHRTRI